MSGRTPNERSLRTFRNRLLRMPLRQRLDAVLASALISLLFFAIILLVSVISYGNAQGWFDTPVIQQLEDERILYNVRDNLQDYTLLDAVLHAPDNHVYISQEGGIVYRYDPTTHLWSNEKPFPKEELVDLNFVALRSGCGTDPTSYAAENCPDTDSIWALGADGSLARRKNGRWEIVVSNSAFIGADGNFVEHKNLTAAAVSDDNRWLILGTNGNGIGIYNINQRLWVPLSSEVMATLPALEITRIVWWDGFAWIGTPKGLVRLDMRRRKLKLIEGMIGEILDIDAEPDGPLWVLEKRSCQEHGDSCLWMGKFRKASSKPEVVIDQRNHFPDLSLADMSFAQQVDDKLMLAGKTGIYGYDTNLHTWERIFEDSVNIVLPERDGNGFYFGYPQGIGHVRNGALQAEWTFPDEGVIKLLFGQENEILALTDAGNLYGVSTIDGAVSAVYEAGATTKDPKSFTMAAAIGSTILFFGEEGGLFHDIERRTYEDVPADALPAWLTDPDSRIILAGNSVFVVARGSSSDSRVYILPKKQAVSASFFIGGYADDIQPQSIPGPVQQTWVWGEQGIGVLAGDGSIYHFIAQEREQVTGEAVPALNDLVFRDVVPFAGDPVFSDGKKLWRYDLTQRKWRSVEASGVHADEAIDELAAMENSMLLRTSNGRLITNDGQVLIGDTPGISIADTDLSDAWDTSSLLYLAGAGRVEAYSYDERKISETWVSDDRGGVAIKGLTNGAPLIHFDGKVALGDSPIDADAGEVVTVSSDDNFIWTVRRDRDSLYLKGHAISAPNNQQMAVCYFRNASAGNDVTEVYDARELNNGIIAVATNAGIRFYDPRARSWFAAPDNLLQANRLYRLADRLLLVEGGENSAAYRLSFVDIDSIRVPHSCSASERVGLKATQALQVRAVAVSEATGWTAWIGKGGAVMEWRSGAETELLAADGGPPASLDLRRIFDYSATSHLLFTTDKDIWRYDLQKRFWSRIQLNLADNAGGLRDINIEKNGESYVVAATSVSGDMYWGKLKDGDQSVNLKRIFTANLPKFGESANNLLDVQTRDPHRHTWTFVLRDKIKYFDPLNRTWEQSQSFPVDESYSFQEAMGRGVLVGENGNIWQIATQTGDAPETFVSYRLQADDQAVALDSDGQVWRLTTAGEIMKCAIKQNEYVCEKHKIPMLLSSTDVLHALEWRGFVIFETPTGLRAFNQSDGEEYGLGQEEGTFNDISFSRTYEDRIFFYSQQNESILVLDSGLKQTDIKQVADFIIDDAKRPWAYFDDDWHWFDGRRFRSLSEKIGGTVQVFARNGSPVAVLGDDLVPWVFEKEDLVGDGLPLPDQFQPDEIEFLARDGNAWWVFGNGQVARLESDVCYAPPTQSPSLTESEPLTDTATSAITDTITPLPTPTPTPTPEPCLAVRTQIPLTAQEIVWVEIENGVLHIVDAAGRVLRIVRASDGSYKIDESIANTSVPTYPIKDDWPQLQANVTRLPNGNMAYDPFVAINLRDRSLLAKRKTGKEERLATKAIIPKSKIEPFTIPPALDVGWLSWNRNNTTFGISTGRDRQTFSKTDIIQDGRLIFEDANAVLATGSGDFQIANHYGVWVFKQPDLDLNSDAIFYPESLPIEISAAHGAFVTSNQLIIVDSNQLDHRSIKNPSTSIGDAIITEDIRERTVSGEVTISGQREDAFALNGFLWDARRRGIAYDGRKLMLQSDAGIHPVDSILVDFDAGPGGLGRDVGILQSTADGEVYLFDPQDEQWHRRSGGNWRAVSGNPYQTRTLLENETWLWRLDSGSLSITLFGNAHEFSFAERDMSFSSDELLAAASVSNKLVVATNAFLEIADNPTKLQFMNAVRTNPIHSDRFETFHFADGHLELFNYLNGDTFKWNPSQNNFSSVANPSDPAVDRPLVENDRLRFTLHSGIVDKELRLNRFQGGSNWSAFSFYKNRFPFDYVTTLAVFDGVLYTGTQAGLSVFRNNEMTSWHTVAALYDMRQQPNDQLAPVLRLGTPVSDDNLLMAVSQNICIERSSSFVFRDCRDLSLLNNILRLKSGFWQWYRDSDNHLIGQYVQADKTLSSDEIHIIRGRLPHDLTQNATLCGSQAFAMWDNKWVTIHNQAGFQIDHSTNNYLFGQEKLARLICVKNKTPLTHTTIEPGLYLESTAGKIWRYYNQTWMSLSNDELITGIRDYTIHPPIYQSQRLRLRLPVESENLMFEQRALNGKWFELPWRSDKQSQTWQVTIDKWRQIVDFDNVLWVNTPQGFINILRRAGEAHIDPDALTVIREPVDSEANICNITDTDVLESKVVGRCDYDSDKVYEGVLNEQKDQDVFTKMTSDDPFAVQTVIPLEQTDYWEWQVSGRVGGKKGHLSGSFHDEDMRLVGGTFSFDAINSLALFQEEKLEIGTRLGGWWQSSRTDLKVGAFTRPRNKVVEDVSSVWLTRTDAERALCLQLDTGKYIRILADGSEEGLSSCQEYLENDGLWTYAKEGGALTVRAQESIGGLGVRNLRQGRFTDDIVEGLPATGFAQGRIAYLIPTASGVLEFDENLSKSKIYSGPFSGLEEKNNPHAVYWFDENIPAYAGRENLYSLDAKRQPLREGLFSHLNDRTILEIAQGKYGLMYTSWTSQADDVGWAFIDPQTLQTMNNGMVIDISGLDKFQRKRLQWGLVNSTMSILFDKDKITILFDPAAPQIVPLPSDFKLVAPILVENRILLIGRQDLLELNLEGVMEMAMERKGH